MNVFDFLPEEDILKTFDNTWFNKIFQMKKWLEQKKLLDKMIDACSKPKLKKGDYSKLVEPLKKILLQKHNKTVTAGVKIIKLLAKQLKKGFQNEAILLTASIIQLLKHSNSILAKEAKDTLEIFFNCYSLIRTSDKYIKGLQ